MVGIGDKGLICVDYNSIVDFRRFSELLQGKIVQFPEISLIYLFGSQAEGHAGPKSDINLGIVIDPLNDEIATASRLAHQLKAALPDQSFDVVPLIFASIELTRGHFKGRMPV